jgi:hypothetical protein
MCGTFFNIGKNDALAKARGEPTRGFHNIQPNYSNPEIIAAIADKEAGRSTKFYDTGVPNVWQQYADKGSKKQAAVVNRQTSSASPKGPDKRANLLVSGAPRKEYAGGRAEGNLGRKTLLGG